MSDAATPPSRSPLVVAIDGPSGSGKSSTARGVAERLGLDFLDTGAMYRAVTWAALDRGLDPADRAAVARLAREAELEVSLAPGAARVAIDGVDVTAAIREPRVSAAVSAVATNLDVRDTLIARQRQIITGSGGIVAEGRDITTVVAPDADVRVLLVAHPEARIARRHAELEHHAVDAETVHDQIVRRDRDDATVAQFERAADGVTLLDSTDLTLTEVVDAICSLAEARTTL